MKMFKKPPTTAETTALHRARAGAAWLDQVRPGWDRRVNLTELRLDNCTSCVLGQVYGSRHTSFYNGFDRAIVLYNLSHHELAERGFVHTPYVTYEQLDAAWTVLLEERAAQRARQRKQHESYAEGYSDGYEAGLLVDPPVYTTARDIVDRLNEEMSTEVADEVATF